MESSHSGKSNSSFRAEWSCPILTEPLSFSPGTSVLCIPKAVVPAEGEEQTYFCPRNDGRYYTPYDFDALNQWLRSHLTDPLTNSSLVDVSLLRIRFTETGMEFSEILAQSLFVDNRPPIRLRYPEIDLNTLTDPNARAAYRFYMTMRRLR